MQVGNKQKHKHRRSNSTQIQLQQRQQKQLRDKQNNQNIPVQQQVKDTSILIKLKENSICYEEILKCVTLSSSKIQNKQTVVEELDAKGGNGAKKWKNLKQIQQELRDWDQFQLGFLKVKICNASKKEYGQAAIHKRNGNSKMQMKRKNPASCQLFRNDLPQFSHTQKKTLKIK